MELAAANRMFWTSGVLCMNNVTRKSLDRLKWWRVCLCCDLFLGLGTNETYSASRWRADQCHSPFSLPLWRRSPSSSASAFHPPAAFSTSWSVKRHTQTVQKKTHENVSLGSKRKTICTWAKSSSFSSASFRSLTSAKERKYEVPCSYGHSNETLPLVLLSDTSSFICPHAPFNRAAPVPSTHPEALLLLTPAPGQPPVWPQWSLWLGRRGWCPR